MTSIKTLALDRADVFTLPLAALRVVEGFNVREELADFIKRMQGGSFAAPPADIVEIAASIRANGVQQPMSGHRAPDDTFPITAGHRRYAGATYAVHLIEKEKEKCSDRARLAELKAELKRCREIPFMLEPKDKTDLDRNFDTFTSNDGKPLNLLEQAVLFQRLMSQFNVSEKEIIRRTGQSKTHVANCFLLLNGAAPELLSAVKKGTFSASLAIEMVRKQPDKAEQSRMVKEAEERAAAAGRQQVSAKHLNESDREKIAPSKSKKKAAAKAADAQPQDDNGEEKGRGAGKGSAPIRAAAERSPAPAPAAPKPDKDQETGKRSGTIGESTVAGATATPAEHIIALRNKFKKDKRCQKGKTSERYVTLNMVADYLSGGKYTAEQFEKYFTEYLFGKAR